MSESAFGVVDRHGTYQYKAFGIPGLGLKRGLADDLVVAPYATALALHVDPTAAVANLASLTRAGGEGPLGYYDAIDYTPRKTYESDEPTRSAAPQGVVVRTYMGRGGWSWYTGSAGWLYRAGLESVLGLRRRGATFSIDPCVPAAWSQFGIDWRFGGSTYHITVDTSDRRSGGSPIATLDGAAVEPTAIPLVDDGQVHEVTVRYVRSPIEARGPASGHVGAKAPGR